MDDRPKKTIQINPDFLKLPLKGNRSRKNRGNSETPKPIKIRTEKKTDDNKTIKLPNQGIRPCDECQIKGPAE
jgi:hypothetical protein